MLKKRQRLIATSFIMSYFLVVTSVLALEDKQCESCMDSKSEVLQPSSTQTDLYLFWQTTPLLPTNGVCTNLNAYNIQRSKLHVCGIWWGAEVVELSWNWLPIQVADNNIASGWGSWTGIFDPQFGFLYLKWHFAIDSEVNNGNPTATSGLPGGEPD